MILEIDNVELYFRAKRILSGVYVKAETGKVTGILGSNGCGKSCLLQIIFGGLKPKFKLIRINHKPVLKSLYQTDKVAILPQHNFIPNRMQLKTAFQLFKVDWSSFLDTFKHLTISKTSKFKTLSGGERRLVETFIVLKSNKDIVLLDEPFSHLTPLHIEAVKAIISEEKKNKVILITDHMYRHIIDVSDDIYLLKNGCTKLVNKPRELEDYKYVSSIE